ncbi:hypothetical protein GWI33_004380 [Rhynchophorus ferrugineus]|uniref:Uncharacterized protein n=1 Tax=Rhynchophorus ferrugineus TaxID=354439 RepID=A0A834ITB3_RHYFE|nr:hypothetical protein GWI33_004380 [Rhynchophorus ferrugineus]
MVLPISPGRALPIFGPSRLLIVPHLLKRWVFGGPDENLVLVVRRETSPQTKREKIPRNPSQIEIGQKSVPTGPLFTPTAGTLDTAHFIARSFNKRSSWPVSQ